MNIIKTFFIAIGLFAMAVIGGTFIGLLFTQLSIYLFDTPYYAAGIICVIFFLVLWLAIYKSQKEKR